MYGSIEIWKRQTAGLPRAKALAMTRLRRWSFVALKGFTDFKL